jgi:DNA-binding HxlR family transcriptional regulator
VAKRAKSAGGNGSRSGCPVNVSLERFGDRWSLLLIRDMMVRGYRTFKEFQESGEGIATNILADRLDRLRESGIVTAEADDTDGRRVIYRLTEKGIDLAPVMLELLIWASRHEETAAPCEVMAHMEANRAKVIEEVRRRWRERDPEPFLRPFSKDAGRGRNGSSDTKQTRKGVGR